MAGAAPGDRRDLRRRDGRGLDRARVAALVAAYDFAPFGTVVDVGGGRGALLAGILRANPGVRGVLFDLPHVVAGAEADFAAAGVADRASVVPGDFFAAVPAGGDAYILSVILHDWDDERSAAILAKCRRAMAGRGAAPLRARAPERRGPPLGALLHRPEHAPGLGGRERTEAEWRALLAAAGFTLTRIVPTTAGVSLIEGATRRGRVGGVTAAAHSASGHGDCAPRSPMAGSYALALLPVWQNLRPGGRNPAGSRSRELPLLKRERRASGSSESAYEPGCCGEV